MRENNANEILRFIVYISIVVAFLFIIVLFALLKPINVLQITLALVVIIICSVIITHYMLPIAILMLLAMLLSLATSILAKPSLLLSLADLLSRLSAIGSATGIIFLSIVIKSINEYCVEPGIKLPYIPRNSLSILLRATMFIVISLLICLICFSPLILLRLEEFGRAFPGPGLYDLLEANPVIRNIMPFIIHIIIGISLIFDFIRGGKMINKISGKILEECFWKYLDTHVKKILNNSAPRDEEKEKIKCIYETLKKLVSPTIYNYEICQNANSTCKTKFKNQNECVNLIRSFLNVVPKVLDSLSNFNEYKRYMCNKNQLYTNLTKLSERIKSQISETQLSTKLTSMCKEVSGKRIVLENFFAFFSTYVVLPLFILMF